MVQSDRYVLFARRLSIYLYVGEHCAAPPRSSPVIDLVTMHFWFCSLVLQLRRVLRLVHRAPSFSISTPVFTRTLDRSSCLDTWRAARFRCRTAWFLCNWIYFGACSPYLQRTITKTTKVKTLGYLLNIVWETRKETHTSISSLLVDV